MTSVKGNFMVRRGIAALCALLLSASALVYAQDPAAQGPPPPPAQMLAPQQLDDLVAPVALYPDSLLSQILVACTYPLEVVEVGQWLRQNGNLRGPELVEAARQQNWDASVQALVVFPDVVARLNQDVRWTTDLGNAFLAQQADVMSAVQRMRGRAQSNGRLSSTPQQSVTYETQGDQRAIVIQPTDPQVVYVPVYDPTYIWGPPVYGYYPRLFYPGVGLGFSFGRGITIGAFFGGGGGWGGWGWGPSWFNRTVVVNNYFMHRYRFNDYHGGGDFRGTTAWSHDPGHRLGVPYSNRYLDSRYRGASSAQFRSGGAGAGARFGNGGQQSNSNGGNASFGNRGNFGNGAQQSRPAPQSAQPGTQFGNNRSVQQQNPAANGGFGNRGNFGTSAPQSQRPAAQSYSGNHSAFGGIQDGTRTRVQSDHGFSSMGSQRSQGSVHNAPAPTAHTSSGSHDGGGRRR